MKVTHTLAAFVMAAAVVVSAQSADSKPGTGAAAQPAAGNVEQTLMKMERDGLAALLKRDVASFGRLVSDDAVMTTPDGASQTKAQLLADLKSGALVMESSEISDMKVRVFGDAAIVTYTTADKGKFKGQDISGRYRWTDVFVRRGGTWQIVSGQGTPIQPAAK